LWQQDAAWRVSAEPSGDERRRLVRVRVSTADDEHERKSDEERQNTLAKPHWSPGGPVAGREEIHATAGNV
jgi:hypothetical protein